MFETKRLLHISGRISLLVSLGLYLLMFGASWWSIQSKELKLISVTKIWDQADHNAFTDLEYFQGKWFCAFREGKSHVLSNDYGVVRVIASVDGESWKSVALLKIPGMDLRDAKLSITPNGRLLLNSWVYNVDASGEERLPSSYSVSYISQDGVNWGEANRIGDPGIWIWQTSWIGDNGYALGYRGGNDDRNRLYHTKDGKKYTLHLDSPRPPGDKSNEHSLVFDKDGNATMLLRRDNPSAGSGGHGLLGKSKPPYRDWEWERLPVRIGGPNLLLLPDGRLLACVRRYFSGSNKTELGFVDSETGHYEPELTLPSGGDTSYAGMVLKGSQIWLSYYSSHQRKTSIYLAKISVPKLSPFKINDRRQLFVDESIVSRKQNVDYRRGQPMLSGEAVKFDKPWEGVFSGYPTVLKDNNIYHLYYRGLPVAKHTLDVEVTCHATSIDGIHWYKPKYSKYTHMGYDVNNIVLANHPACHNFAPFIDSNPNALDVEKFKAFGGTDGDGLFLFVSPNGVDWKQKGDGPVFRDDFKNGWAFDSQNVGFWSTSEKMYLLYYRRFIDGIRKIYRVESDDLMNWSDPIDTKANLPNEHLYTNQTQPYYRASQFYVAFPKRFFPGKVAIDPDIAEQLVEDPNYRKDTADSIFLSSRSKPTFHRPFNQGFIRPGESFKDWISRSNAIGLGVVPAKGIPHKMYLYRLSHYGQGSAHLSRYELRTDGFAHYAAGDIEGVFVTTPIIFDGTSLEINASTSAGGYVRVEMCQPFGKSLAESSEIIGDQVSRIIKWKSKTDIRSFAGHPIQLKFYLKDADLYSFKFNR